MIAKNEKEEATVSNGKKSQFPASLRFTYDYDGSKIQRR